MLQTIRDRAQGWFAWLIVFLITIPFALWGIQEYVGGGTEPEVATVNGTPITERAFEERFRDFRNRLRNQLGASYRPELFDDAVLRQEVLDAMIRDEVLRQTAERLGLRAGDAMVRSAIGEIPAFNVGGSFNQLAYEQGLRTQGMTPVIFEEQVRQDLVQRQLSQAVAGSEPVSDAELAEYVRLNEQRRDLAWMMIPASEFTAAVALNEGEAKAHYDSHQADYLSPEQVKLQYIELDLDHIAATLQADEAALRSYYEEHLNDYQSPEQRRASHLLVGVEEGAEGTVLEAARGKAQAALQRVRDGAAFAEVAKEVSEDPGSAEQGGDLGFFEKGVMDPAFETAAFALQPGEISELVQSRFGFHIIQLNEVRPAAGKPFEEAVGDVRKAYLKGEAERLFYDFADRLGNIAYEQSGSLSPAAENLGLELQESDWIVRGGGAGIFANPKVQRSAFSEEVLGQRINSEAIELSNDHLVVLRVLDHKDASAQPFEEVQARIEEQLKQEKAAALAKAKGTEWVGRLQGGSALAALATEEGRSVEQQEGARRNSPEVPREVLQLGFRLERPAEGAVSVGDVAMSNGDVALVTLQKVTDGTLDEMSDDEKKRLRATLGRSKGQATFDHLAQELRAAATIVIHERAMRRRD
jgi:peptidyl-prolyl cis-trans isomerase D